MHSLAKLLAVAVCGAAPLAAQASVDDDLGWKSWRTLPVLNGGRYKPLDSLARESLRVISDRASFQDPETGETLSPTTLWLRMLLDWRGWEHPDRSRLLLLTDWTPEYFHLHKSDKWDRAPLFRVDFPRLRRFLGLDPDKEYVSAARISKVQIDDLRAERTVPFAAWARELVKREAGREPLSELEKKGLELAHRYWTYQRLRMGRSIEVLPLHDSETREWMPLATLLLTDFEDQSDPDGTLRDAQQLLGRIRGAYKANDAQAFRLASVEFVAMLQKLGPELGEYPNASKIELELAYNKWVPFRFAWALTLAAGLSLLLSVGTRFRPFYIVGLALSASGLVAMLTGFAMRVIISGRAPVSNMYESVIYLGLGVAIFAMLFEWIYRTQYILLAGAAVATIALVLADNCPVVLDPSLRPLQPVLRSNFWLVTHVMTITLSYAAFALALGIGNISLAYHMRQRRPQEIIDALTHFTYKTLQVGVLLLAAGTILGGVWADYSWSRFWGWDPKEVWALITLLVYLAVLHARYVGWVQQIGLAALSVICFSLVVMAWYGVNFVLGAGLHSYGFGAGGRTYVYLAVAAQFTYVAIAVWQASVREPRANPIATSLLTAPTNLPTVPTFSGS